MPLIFAETGKAYTIARVGGNAETKKHLEDMGFVTGAVVTVISSLNGNLIVNIKDSRVALDRSLAGKITV